MNKIIMMFVLCMSHNTIASAAEPVGATFFGPARYGALKVVQKYLQMVQSGSGKEVKSFNAKFEVEKAEMQIHIVFSDDSGKKDSVLVPTLSLTDGDSLANSLEEYLDKSLSGQDKLLAENKLKTIIGLSEKELLTLQAVDACIQRSWSRRSRADFGTKA